MGLPGIGALEYVERNIKREHLQNDWLKENHHL